MTDKYEFSNVALEPLILIRNHDDQITRNENDIYKYISILSYLMRKFKTGSIRFERNRI